MADAMDDLGRLIERVEAGTAQNIDFICLPPTPHAKAYGAYNGSLDAAKALHEALLPGWEAMTRMMMNGGEAIVFEVDESGAHKIGKHWVCETKSSSPARAWLLAVLRAYRTAEGGGE
jgi:hypothetical protein